MMNRRLFMNALLAVPFAATFALPVTPLQAGPSEKRDVPFDELVERATLCTRIVRLKHPKMTRPEEIEAAAIPLMGHSNETLRDALALLENGPTIPTHAV